MEENATTSVILYVPRTDEIKDMRATVNNSPMGFPDLEMTSIAPRYWEQVLQLLRGAERCDHETSIVSMIGTIEIHSFDGTVTTLSWYWAGKGPVILLNDGKFYVGNPQRMKDYFYDESLFLDGIVRTAISGE